MKIWATLWVWQESHLPQRLTLKNEAGFQSFTFLAPVDTISKAQFLVLWKNPIWCKDRKNLWKSWVLRKLSPQSTLESTTFASNFCFWSLFEVSFGFFSKTYKKKVYVSNCFRLLLEYYTMSLRNFKCHWSFFQ